MESGLLLTLLLCGLCIGADGRRSPQSASSCESCPAGWTWFGGHCYLFEKSEKDWADAERFCNALDGNLASIQTTDQYQFLRELIVTETGEHKRCWVGGYDKVKEGVWMWSDGSKFTFNHWGKDEPNNYNGGEGCMEMNLEGQDFVNDYVCGTKKPFICMRPKTLIPL